MLDSDHDGELELDDAEYKTALNLTTLQEAGDYLVSSRAFAAYKDRLRRFLHPQPKGGYGTDKHYVPDVVGTVAESTCFRIKNVMPKGIDLVIVGFYKWINDAIWQPPKGAHRVWYLCVSPPCLFFHRGECPGGSQGGGQSHTRQTLI